MRCRDQEVRAQHRRPRGEPQTRELPVDWYGDPAHFEQELVHTLRPSWHAVCRLDEISGASTRFVAELLGEEIVIERAPSGLAARMQPDVGVQLEVWNGFVMVNLDARAPPLAIQVRPLTQHLAPYVLADQAQLDLVEIAADWDWKLSMEHFGATGGLDRAAERVRRLVEVDTNDTWSLRYWEDTRPGRMLPPRADLPSPLTQRVSALNIYPTLHLLVDARKALWLRIAVEGPSRHRLRWTLLVPVATFGREGITEKLEHYRELLSTLLDDQIGTLRTSMAERRESLGRKPTGKSIEQMHRWLWQRVRGLELAL